METRRRKTDPQQKFTADDLQRQDRREEFVGDGDDNAIARRAYELYESRGRQDGQDQEDWFQAEREVRERSSSPVKP